MRNVLQRLSEQKEATDLLMACMSTVSKKIEALEKRLQDSETVGSTKRKKQLEKITVDVKVYLH